MTSQKMLQEACLRGAGQVARLTKPTSRLYGGGWQEQQTLTLTPN